MSWRKKILISVLGVQLFIVFVLPYLLPLNGPAHARPSTIVWRSPNPF
jgi:hypothetical protein